MSRVRMMDTPEDYERLGVSSDGVEKWEDGRRTEPAAGIYEWWYFDAILDDDTKIVAHFNTSDRDQLHLPEDVPSVNIEITDPDGTLHKQVAEFAVEDATFATDGCDTRIGPHRFQGDLRTYRIHVEPTDGVGADLVLTSTATPFRPGTGYIGFGDDDEMFFTWLCAVPRGDVSGTITIDGEVREVTGRGYHDHQWSNINPLRAWNTWLWARQNFGDYSILVFDFVAGGEFGFTRFPVAFIHDGEGNLVFENTRDVSFDVFEEYTDPESGKDYPKDCRYTFDDDGQKITYRLAVKDILGTQNAYVHAPDKVKAMFDQMGKSPSYGRYLAQGDLVIGRTDGPSVERSGELIYEFVYSGVSYREHV